VNFMTTPLCIRIAEVLVCAALTRRHRRSVCLDRMTSAQ